MRYENKNYFEAIAVMVGSIIGVGMFGVPYLITKSGLLSFFVLLIVLGLMQYLSHSIYATVILESKGYHRLTGYAEIYLGSFWKMIAFLGKIFGNYGALLAYTVINGIFANQLLGPYFGGNEFIYASIIFFIQALILFFNINILAKVELIMTFLLLLIVGLITFQGLGFISLGNFQISPEANNWYYFFLPFGAMLFALDGASSLPLVVRILKKDEKAIKKTVFVGTLLPAVIIVIFTLIVLGVSGSSVTEDALSGLKDILGGNTMVLALIFGITTMITSFLGVAQAIKETLWWDFKINKNIAWALAVFVPYLLYIFGFNNLIQIISLVGAIGGGICSIILLAIFYKIKTKSDKISLFKYKPNNFILILLALIFVLGAGYEIVSFFGML